MGATRQRVIDGVARRAARDEREERDELRLFSIWGLDDAPHVRGLVTHQQQYEQRVIGFLDDALLGGP